MDLDPQQAGRDRPINVQFSAAQQSEAAAAEYDEINSLKKKLEETTLLLEVLAQVNILMGKNSGGFADFFVEVCKLLKEKLGFDFLYVWLRDEKNETILRLVTPEGSDDFRTMSVNTGIVGQSIRERRTIFEPDVGRNPQYLHVHKDTRAELCVPLICDNGVIGAINIESADPRKFDGKITIIEVIAENLSRSIKVALLHSTDKQFRGLVESMTEGIWTGNPQEQTKYTNLALQRMMGFSAGEFMQKTSLDLFDEECLPTVRLEIEKRQRGVSSDYEAVLKAKNGSHIPVIVHAVPVGGGDTMAVFTDLRAIKKAEKELLRAQRFLASITQYCPEAIVGLDENGIVQSWNAAAERMFGFKSEEVIGKSTEIIIPKDRIASGELTQIINESKTKGFVRNFETIRVHKNGKPTTISMTMSAVHNEDGQIIGLSAQYRDITAQKKWERELQDRFEKMQDAYREMGKQRRHLDYMIDMINMSASPSVTQKQLAVFAVNAITITTRVDAATIRVLDPQNGKLILIAQSGLGEDWWSKKAIPFSGSLLEYAVQHGGPVKILDILSDARYKSPALARKNNLRSALIIPLQAKGEVVGSMTLYLSQESSFSLLDDEFSTSFAKQTALALKLAGSP